jgi:acyl-coenzyme A synthetase/AMP-(fatty) acid ligase
MIALAKHGSGGRYDLSSLRCIGSGAAPLGKDVIEVVADKFPDAEIIQVSGHLELCCAVLNLAKFLNFKLCISTPAVFHTLVTVRLFRA